MMHLPHDRKQLRVLLRTNTPLLAEGFLAFAAGVDGIYARTADTNGDLFYNLVEEMQPHILMLDVAGPVDFSAIIETRKRCSSTQIVVWTHGISLEVAHQVRAAGVRGILRKDSSKEQVLRCLTEVAAGEPWFERSLLNSLLEVKRVRLSPRERQLMRLVAQGFSNKQLAGELMISEGTVKVYLAKLFRKIGVHDRYELAMFGLRSMGVTAVDIMSAASNYPLFADSIVFEQPRHAASEHVSPAEPARALRQTA